MKVVIAGGGTGGHLFPALAVAEVLQERKHDVVILISEKEVDALATRERTEFRFEKLPTVGMPKLFSFAIFGFMKRLNESLAPCRALYKRFQPDAVLGMGGFTSTSPILAGRLRRIPAFVHESNAIPGKANRLNARLATGVLLGFEECRRYFPKSKCKVTGTPIRKSLMTRMPKEQARALFGLQPDRTTLLVMGGSQGAHGINELMIKAAPALASDSLQIIHLTGPEDEQLVMANYRRENIPACVSAFHHRMEEAYSAADLAVARSGAASLTELSHFRIPSILIPYPFAADNHQTLNAQIFERAGAGIVAIQRDTTPESLSEKLRSLVNNASRLKAMSAACGRLATDDAAKRIVDILEESSR